MGFTGPRLTDRYFTEPPRFQLLHCRRNNVIGGDSYFVDSFASMVDFQRDHPEMARLLQRVEVPYEYDNDGHFMRNSHPIFPSTLDHLRSAIAWSPPFQGSWQSDGDHPTDLSAAKERAQRDHDFFKAVRLWQSYIEDPKRHYTYKMEEGDLVLFDNRRVLHARTAFRDMTPQEVEENKAVIVKDQPSRWLKGCYLDGDEVWDKLMVLEMKSRAVSADALETEQPQAAQKKQKAVQEVAPEVVQEADRTAADAEAEQAPQLTSDQKRRERHRQFKHRVKSIIIQEQKERRERRERREQQGQQEQQEQQEKDKSEDVQVVQ